MDVIKLFVGHDAKEAIAFDVFVHSVVKHSSQPVSITPLALNNLRSFYDEKHTDGSNEFIYSRFLVPHLCNYMGWALYVDGDMLCQDDIVKLWRQRDSAKAVMVAKHDYKTKSDTKYLGCRNEDYPRKNWSSVILFNCGHPANFMLQPDFVASRSGRFLHRFSWLPDELIGGIDPHWNWLVGEYGFSSSTSLVHFTLGTPCFGMYKSCDYANEWYHELKEMLTVQGEEGLGWIQHAETQGQAERPEPQRAGVRQRKVKGKGVGETAP